MVEIALVFVGLGLLVLLGLLASAIYFIPRVLEEEEHDEDSHAGGRAT